MFSRKNHEKLKQIFSFFILTYKTSIHTQNNLNTFKCFKTSNSHYNQTQKMTEV